MAEIVEWTIIHKTVHKQYIRGQKLVKKNIKTFILFSNIIMCLTCYFLSYLFQAIPRTLIGEPSLRWSRARSYGVETHDQEGIS